MLIIRINVQTIDNLKILFLNDISINSTKLDTEILAKTATKIPKKK